MYLSKLEIIGFKSFAQRVNLSFDNGISAIVGPNGCGKSNIVDAIRWVLGEQRYSTLRSDKMEDVIFNGTKARKALGMAEASLVIENTKGILPSEYSQVTVGRRVFRSGESEYLLNKAPCRLKDILDLFMDTGMGSDAYSVIELKMVETILSDKTDERRHLFEEASGVTKYKHRRKAAYRKLEAVQSDLMRVNDIIVEVHKAVNSLERQARKAEQYNDLKSGLRTLEVDLLEREFAQLHERLEPLETQLGAMNEVRSRQDIDLQQEEDRLEALRTAMGGIEGRVAETRTSIAGTLDVIHQGEQRMVAAEERARSIDDTVRRCELDIAESTDGIANGEKRLEELRETLLSLGEEEQRVSTEKARVQEQLRDLDMTLEEKKANQHDLNERTLAIVHEIASLQSEQERKQGLVDALHVRIRHGEEETERYQKNLVELDARIGSRAHEDAQLRRRFSESEVKFYKAEKGKTELKEKIDILLKTQLDLQNDINSRRSRIDFLKGVMESGEALSEGVRFLSSLPEWRGNKTVTIADAVHADEKHRVAIEAALGEYAGLILVDHDADARRGITLLRQNEKGKATFICLDRLPRIRRRAQALALPGVIGWAVEVARFDRSLAPLFVFILDRVLIVRDAETADEVMRHYAGVRCVTLDGQVTTGVGVLRGGSKRSDEGGLIGKQQQLEDFQRELDVLQSRMSELEVQIADLQREHDAIDLKSAADEVKTIEKEMSAVEIHLAQLEFEKQHAREIIARNSEEAVGLQAQLAELHQVIEVGRPDLERVRAERAELEKATAALAKNVASLEVDRVRISGQVSHLGIREATLHGERQNVDNELQHTAEHVAMLQSTIQRRREDIQRAAEERSFVEAGTKESRLAVAAARLELSRLEAARAAIEGEASSVREEIHLIEQRIRDERRSHDDSMKAAHELDLKVLELKSRMEVLRSRAREEFEFELQRKQYPDHEFVDFAALREEVQAFKNKLKSLGNVNFAAFEEYTQEKQRFEFLTAQRNDLLEAEKTLLSTIEEINQTAQRKFLETFARIRENFMDIFKSLFDPGDECDLRLEEGVDPLEAGIDIIAKPRGKRPTSIQMLSGGEKTLTATALLFAIYLVKPSPFCILDEVDAPLDDANIDRFTRLLTKFSNNTQFIVVTHNKRTMEAANALYGVTMEEEGISKIVTVRFNRGAEVTSAAMATQ